MHTEKGLTELGRLSVPKALPTREDVRRVLNVSYVHTILAADASFRFCAFVIGALTNSYRSYRIYRSLILVGFTIFIFCITENNSDLRTKIKIKRLCEPLLV